MVGQHDLANEVVYFMFAKHVDEMNRLSTFKQSKPFYVEDAAYKKYGLYVFLETKSTGYAQLLPTRDSVLEGLDKIPILKSKLRENVDPFTLKIVELVFNANGVKICHACFKSAKPAH